MTKSFDSSPRPVREPSPWFVRHAGLIRAGGPVLDLACGDGRHTRHFAQLRHPVTAVDIDVSGVADLAATPGIEVLALDLETGTWPFADRRFAAILVANYMHRPHFAHLPATLEPGGVLLFETFGQGNERFGRPRNPDFLLAPGELLEAFGDVLQIVAYEHGIEEQPRPAVRKRLVAIRQTGPAYLPL